MLSVKKYLVNVEFLILFNLSHMIFHSSDYCIQNHHYKIGEKPVHHQARKYGSSKFMGWNRFFNGYLDLITLWFLSSFGKKPMHVFGFLGTLMFFIGFVSAFALGVDKLWCLSQGIPQRLVTDSPYFYISLTMMMIGTQFFLAGFIGDLVSRSSQNRNDYQIEKTLKCENNLAHN